MTTSAEQSAARSSQEIRYVKRLAPLERTARRSVRSLQPEYPVNILAVEARACKLHKNAEQHQALERMDGMLAWNGQQDNMIDRFDGRALLDFYRESDGMSRERTKSADDRRLERVRWGRLCSYAEAVTNEPCVVCSSLPLKAFGT